MASSETSAATPLERSAFLSLQRGELADRFARGAPFGALVALLAAVAAVVRRSPALGLAPAFAALGVAALLLLTKAFSGVRLLREHPDAMVVGVGAVTSAGVAILAAQRAGFDDVLSGLLVVCWMYVTVIAPLPVKRLAVVMSTQVAVVAGGVVLVSGVPERFPLLFVVLHAAAAALAFLASRALHRAEERAFVLASRLEDARAQLGQKRDLLAARAERLEGEVARRVAEALARAKDADELDVRLRAQVDRRSRVLASSIADAAEEEAPASMVGARSGTSIGGRFRVERPSGSGAYGHGYLAHDATSGQPCRVTVARDVGALDPDVFLGAIEAARAARDAAFPEVIAAGVEGGRPWVASARPDGVPLERVLSTGLLPAGTAARLFARAAQALAIAHAAGVPHLDLGARWVMWLSPDTGVTLLHLGFADAWYRARARAGETPDLSGELSIDVHGLAVLLATALGGPLSSSSPPGGEAGTVPEMNTMSIRRHLTGHPRRLVALVEQMFGPPEACPSMADVAARLESIADVDGAPTAVELARALVADGALLRTRESL